MSWTDTIGNLLQQYTGGAAAGAQPASDVQAHFDEVSQAVPSGTLAQGLAEAFRSDRTPGLPGMLSRMFLQSNPEQKAGLLNHLLTSIAPSTFTQALSGTALAGLFSGGKPQVTEEQAQYISPQDVEQLATHAQGSPLLIDSLSNFYAQHKHLVKTLGAGTLAVALAKIAENRRESSGP